MGAQVALALVLLVSSGLMVRSFQKLRALDPGFDATSALTFRVGLPETRLPDSRRGRRRASRDARSPVGAARRDGRLRLDLPAARGRLLSATRCAWRGAADPAGTMPPIALFRAVAGGYFEAMGMRLLRGRGIDRGDVDRSEPVVVVNEALAKTVLSESGSDRPARRLEPAAGATG